MKHEDDRESTLVVGGKCPTCEGRLDTGGDYNDLICIECGDEFSDEGAESR